MLRDRISVREWGLERTRSDGLKLVLPDIAEGDSTARENPSLIQVIPR